MFHRKMCIRDSGKNGQPFAFHLALPVDASGTLPDGRAFQDVRDLKRVLLTDERGIARNLTNQLMVYATGAPISFGDRPRIEAILDQAAASHYAVRTLVQGIIHSELFQHLSLIHISLRGTSRTRPMPPPWCRSSAP